MGFRFRRSVKILPGVKLNFGKRGMSATVGRRGATLNLGRRGAHANAGLPGTGLSYRERLDLPGSRSSGGGGRRAAAWLLRVVLGLWLAGLLLG
jgi:hypothetical protein